MYKNMYLLLMYVQLAYFPCKILTKLAYLINFSCKIDIFLRERQFSIFKETNSAMMAIYEK